MFKSTTLGSFWMIISFIALTAVTAKSKYYDAEIRPYEFGYRIEGNQHRHEKKDENGIISGEFGFITGDGTYHESVYATDENGNFKLISSRSSFRIVKTTTVAPTTTLPPKPVTRTSKSLKVLKSCSNCKVFEKEVYDKSSPTAPESVAITTIGDKIYTKSLNIASHNVHNALNEGNHDNVLNDGGHESVLNQGGHNNVGKPEHNIKNIISTQIVPNDVLVPKMKVKSASGTIDTISPLNVALGISTAGIKASEQIRLKQKERHVLNDLKIKSDGNTAHINGPVGIRATEQAKLKYKEIDDTKALNKIPSHQTSKPVHAVDVAIPNSLQTKSEITVPISTDDIHSRTLHSSKTHLSSKNEINEFIGDVLYRFNYTAGYHGHNEEGDSAGNKRGGYFIIGRDNIRRGVIYVANSNGFIPVVKYEKVSSAEAPHEDTEKSAGLKGYEFEWFHKSRSKTDNVS